MFSLPTKYNGYNFRSRTEARWAVFFDAMKIKYYYEHEDFILPNGRRYLPDFYLPNYDGNGCIVEVKGEFTEEEKQMCFDLFKLTNTTVIMLEGVPDFKVFECYLWQDIKSKEQTTTGLFCHPQSKYGNRIYVEPGFSSEYFTPNDWHHWHEKAVFLAREAQFEHGAKVLI